MHRSNRATLAVSLGLVGVASLAGRSFGQAPQQQDKAVRPAAAASAPATAAVGPASM